MPNTGPDWSAQDNLSWHCLAGGFNPLLDRKTLMPRQMTNRAVLILECSSEVGYLLVTVLCWFNCLPVTFDVCQ